MKHTHELPEDMLVRLAQNDYMIDGKYLPDGEALVQAAAELARLRRVETEAKALLNCHTGAPWQTQDIKNRAFRNLSSALEG